MKKLLFVLALMLSLYSYAGDVTTVHIKFKNATDEFAYLYRPVRNRIYFATDTIRDIRNDSVYQYRVEISKPSYLSLVVPKKENVHLLVQPGDKVVLEYDFSREQPCTFDGNNATGQVLLNEWISQTDPYQYEWIRDYNRAPLDSIPEKMEANFRKIEKRDMARFDSLFQTKGINKGFHQFVKTDIQLYYLATFSRIARNASDAINKEAYYQYWTQLYKRYPVEKMEMGSIWFPYYGALYVESYLQIKKKKEGKEEARPTSFADYLQMNYRNYLNWPQNKELQEFLLGKDIHSSAINNKTNSTDILPIFNQFKKEFPNSPYHPLFARYANDLEIYQKKITKDFSPNTHFMEKTEELKTLKDVFDRLKGKAVFVDFWFSTCGPCREEFKYAKPLKEFLQKHQIELLYVSIDKDRADENWKNSIKSFDLEGWHVRVPHDVHVDMSKNYGINLYPTYMLIDKDGNCKIKRAKLPSEKKNLYQQILEALQ